jgi:phosphatidylglycerophosphatase A
MGRLICSCFGLGWMPIAPGTWGSLPSAVIFFLLCACSAPLAEINVVMFGLVIIGSVACVVYAPASIAATGKLDPSEVVMDEFAGQGLTFVSISALAPQNALVAAVVGFLLFRLFDIFKPWPANRLEALPSGWGILLDDIMAGIYASIIFNILTISGLLQHFSKIVNHLL